ncbi:MAG: putative sulfate exporter family transporter [Alphaproteobacteria bacterium]|nr:putative sulfate exporter family transporter [Alphaproteobacteria bacterium]
MHLRLVAFRVLLAVGILLCLLPVVSAPMALAAGMLIALVIGNPALDFCMKTSRRTLAFSVAGLGAGMNLYDVLHAGAEGIVYTIIGIAAALAMGALIGNRLRLAGDTTILVSVGTAICGGSAIVAMAPAIRARIEAVAMSLAIVFVLNAVALLVFPPLGHYLGLSEKQFGLWAALAIHDTSSVVGAATAYGEGALENAVVLKMARALWIFPLALLAGLVMTFRFRASKSPLPGMKFPWFIPAFLAVAALFTWLPALSGVADMVFFAAQRGMSVTLFLIGSTITLSAFRSLGWRPLLLGLLLWLFVAAGSLAAIQAGWIG